MNWKNILLHGLRHREKFSRVLKEAAECAPLNIKTILEQLPEIRVLSIEDVQLLNEKGGNILVLCYYFWLSTCGEYYTQVSPEDQHHALETGLKASIKGQTLAANLHEEKIEARFLFKKGDILLSLKKFSEAEYALKKALKKYKNKNSLYYPFMAKIMNALGTLYCKTGIYHTSETMYTGSIALYKKIHDFHGVTVTTHNLGTLYTDTRQFEKAEKAYKETLSLCKKLKKENEFYAFYVIVTYNSLGNLYWHTNQFLRAEKMYTKALKKLENRVKKEDMYTPYMATTLNNMGNLYTNAGRFHKAKAAYERALTLRRVLAQEEPTVYTLDVAMTLGNLGNLYCEMGKYSEAQKMCQNVVRIVESLPEKSFALQSCKAHALNRLGTVYQHLDRIQEAKNVFNEALIIYKRLGQYPEDTAEAHDLSFPGSIDESGQSSSVDTYSSDKGAVSKNVGTLYWHIADFENAHTAYTEALSFYEALAEEYPSVYKDEIADIFFRLGILYQDMHQYSKAEKAYAQALDILQELAEEYPHVYTIGVGLLLNSMGSFFWKINRFSEAEKAYAKAKTILQELAEEYPYAYSSDVAAVLNNMGAIFLEKNEMERSLAMYAEALTIYTDLAQDYPDVYTNDVAMTCNNLGELYQKKGLPLKAEEMFQKALQKYQILVNNNPDAYEYNLVLTMSSLGALYITIKESDKGKHILLEALSIAKRRAFWFRAAEVYQTLCGFVDKADYYALWYREVGILVSGEKEYAYVQKGKAEKIYLQVLEQTADPLEKLGILEALRDPDLLSNQWILPENSRVIHQ